METMTTTMTSTSSIEADLERLQTLARQAASVVRPRLAAADRAGYRAFLNTMFHYTRGSGEKTLRAMRRCPTPDLRKYFEHMYNEEKGHFLLAEADLHKLGYEVDPITPPAVAAFNLWWESVASEQYTAFVGALVVFENIANHCADEVIGLVKRLELRKGESRWLLVHVEADEGHGAEALEMATTYLHVDRESLLAGAEKACALWIEIFRTAFEPIALARIPS